MLSNLANWAQIIGTIPVLLAVPLLYYHHRCHHCWRWARYRVGGHHVPKCGRHRWRLDSRHQ